MLTFDQNISIFKGIMSKYKETTAVTTPFSPLAIFIPWTPPGGCLMESHMSMGHSLGEGCPLGKGKSGSTKAGSTILYLTESLAANKILLGGNFYAQMTSLTLITQTFISCRVSCFVSCLLCYCNVSWNVKHGTSSDHVFTSLPWLQLSLQSSFLNRNEFHSQNSLMQSLHTSP